jgi:hypothetical protein
MIPHMKGELRYRKSATTSRFPKTAPCQPIAIALMSAIVAEGQSLRKKKDGPTDGTKVERLMNANGL